MLPGAYYTGLGGQSPYNDLVGQGFASFSETSSPTTRNLQPSDQLIPAPRYEGECCGMDG